MKEIIKLKEHIKDLENEQISEMKEHEEFCKLLASGSEGPLRKVFLFSSMRRCRGSGGLFGTW